MKDKIIQIIKGYECDAYFGADLNHLKESDYENVAEDIVKLFRQTVVIKSVCVYCKGTKKVNMMNHGEMPCVCTRWPQTVL